MLTVSHSSLRCFLEVSIDNGLLDGISPDTIFVASTAIGLPFASVSWKRRSLNVGRDSGPVHWFFRIHGD